MDTDGQGHEGASGELPIEAASALDPASLDGGSAAAGDASAPTGWLDRVHSAMGAVAGLVILFLMLSISAEVLMRHFLNRPLGWTTEVSEVGLLAITFFASAWVLRQDAHIKVDLIQHFMSERNQARLGIVTTVLAGIACAVLTVYGTQEAWALLARGARSPTLLRLPQGPIMAVIPLGCLFLTIEFSRQARRHFRTLRQG